jgi:hypothetical protein
VGVERDDEIARRHGAPQAEVHAVRPPYDPPQEKVVPLARRSAFRTREEEVALAGKAFPPPVAERVEEPGQVPPEVGGVSSPARDVEALERTVLKVHPAHAMKEPVHTVGGDEPVGKTRDRTTAHRLRARQGGVRRRGEGVEEARQEAPDLENAAEGERCGEKRRGFGIARVGIAVGKRHRVGGKLRARPLPQQAFQRSCKPVGRRCS